MSNKPATESTPAQGNPEYEELSFADQKVHIRVIPEVGLPPGIAPGWEQEHHYSHRFD